MKDKRSIVIIAPETLPLPPEEGGGVQTVIYEQSKRLRDYELTIICPRGSGQEPEESLDHTCYRRIDVPALKGKKQVRAEYIRLVAKIVKDIPACLIHVHNRPEFVLPIHSARKDSSIILHMHNNHLAAIPLRKRKKVIDACSRVVFVSQYLKERAVKGIKISNQKLTVIHNGIDTEKFSPPGEEDHIRKVLRNQYGFNEKDIVMLYVGRIVREKGLLEIIRAMKKVKRKQLKLLVIGASKFGSDQMNLYERLVRKQAKEMGESVRFIGYIPPDELPPYYQMSDVFVSPFRWEEPFGLVIGEAASCGLPIITTRKGAIPEIIEHKKEGLLLPPRFNTSDLIAHLKKIMGNQELRERISCRARKKISRHFTWEISAQNIEKVYQEG
ncbi:glycosyltransferase family 4 protein [Ammoniphilus sp. 3BR4]|uniref:glycosyltransferase family 4 protein n=1 Tax=Ammoniphilus sp. 3BR4 TaxID=3158265 RepID=UPI0034661B4E